ncbi:MAG: AI-2E family transporter [Firmicutes bacterium]|nr:AI-2E family transporter [Bacillota bacterium]MBQ1890755.1 AI-2E family transporter [Bacillota bacterium]MBQ2041897.1 AI-2E family transporter [Bacillota bacterium]
MKKQWQEMKSKWGPLVLGACVVVLFFVALSNIGVVWSIFKFIFRVLLPIIIGAGIAYILNPFTKFYDRTIFKRLKKRKVAWGLSLVLTLIVLLALIFLLLYSLIPQMISSIGNFVENIDEYLDSLMEIVDRWQLPSSDWIESIKGIISSEGGLIEKALQLLIDNIGVIISRSSTFTAGTVNWGIGFILAIYFLADKRRVTGFLKKLLEMFTKPEHYNNVLTVGHKFNTIFAKFISVELIDALIVGVLNYIFMLILGMPYALVTSVVVGIANLVPTFGPIVGGVVGALIQLLANPINALWFIIFTIALQTFDGYWIKPRMFGEFLNVPGVLILISIVVFGRLIGIVGVFLAIPLAAIMIYLFNEFALPRMEARKEHKQKDAPPQS